MGFASYLEDIRNRLEGARYEARAIREQLAEAEVAMGGPGGSNARATSSAVRDAATGAPLGAMAAARAEALLSRMPALRDGLIRLENKLNKLLEVATDPVLDVVASVQELNARIATLENANHKLLAKAERLEQERNQAQDEVKRLKRLQEAHVAIEPVTSGRGRRGR